ncbi:flap endonuclease-1 [Methanothermobacter wolfeii]|uniref:Flap endonuclease 1 n=1 Tax=Methanothermobacter wolfeii TaxID=145261 RepID=A0A9E7RUK4_METWO|nr:MULTISPECIES: flap endonuclease-1 [Methanothermobacter]MDI6701932.1 flap endonuclease-1 [Methanothermobacter wolfeii]MDI6841377.1 flap endonuclease-1 [Methanothermobacter wolfeii]NLM02712.1 flap endonuclease-1 [Methanothermobacter wolfeii]QHN05761.1 flap endonuclease-1 [Methanothermobacter sp. THM-1]UXH31905.1 flap endonuclease-1 [Methanothermobacter wolfeii]
MGVKLKDIVSPRKIGFDDLRGRIVAVDAANSIYQFLSSIRQRDGTPLMDREGRVTSHLSGILYRTAAVMEREIKVFYVFDGRSHHLKGSTISKRVEARKKSEVEWKRALEEGDIERARKYAVRSSRMSDDIVEGSKRLLELMGVPYVQAPSEGEAQASFMVRKGDAWAVASQDYDCLLFGAPRVVRNLTLSGKLQEPEIIELEAALKKLSLTREQLVDLAILVGTDFNPGIKGIGPKKGLKLIRERGDIFGVLEEVDGDPGGDPLVLRRIFLEPDVTGDYELKWRKPDREGVLEFLCSEHGFSEERVLSALKKIEKASFTQKSLEEWF